MYTVTTANALKFLTTDYIPVQTLASDGGEDQWDVQAAAVNGSINIIKVTSGGSGYATAPAVTITGDGSGATATAVLSNGRIQKITMTNYGSGYRWANITITGSGYGVLIWQGQQAPNLITNIGSTSNLYNDVTSGYILLNPVKPLVKNNINYITKKYGKNAGSV
jgi:hypothetical protein